MILSELKGYLRDRRRAPIADIANRFEVSPDAARGMLEVLAQKGRIRRIDAEPCGTCCGCADGRLEIYEWLDGQRTNS